MLFLIENKFSQQKIRYKYKRVQFNTKVQVILIPCIKEYKYFNLIESLWYSKSDFVQFYKEKISDESMLR